MTNQVMGRRGANTQRSANLPALPVVRTGNAALDQFLDAVRERLEVREGSRGDPYERALTVRDLEDAGAPVVLNGSVVRPQPGALRSNDSAQAFSTLLGSSTLFSDLLRQVRELKAGNDVPERVKELIATSLADEAQKRGADIRTLAYKLQSEVESLSYTLSEITAGIQGASAGIREVQYASATANRTTAGRVTKMVAALDGTGKATFNESVQVIADRMQGLRSQYMLQLNAGNAVSGISLLASEDPTGATKSAFIVQADQFAVAAPVNFSQETTPSATVIGQVWYKPSTKAYFRATATGTAGWTSYTPSAPFGVDTITGTVYVNGQLKINANGDTLQTLAGNAAVPNVNFIGNFATAPSTTGLKKNSVYKNTTDGNSYILKTDGGAWELFLEKGMPGTPGAPGSPGSPGERGSLTGYGSKYNISSSAWNDGQANAVIYNMLYGSSLTSYGSTWHLRIGDTVTLSNGSSFAATKYWGGTGWLAPGVTIDGNLLVTGTISADKINGGDFTGKTFTGGSFTGGSFTGGADINITGGAKFSGNKTATNFQGQSAAVVANDSLSSDRGLIAVTNKSEAQAVVGYNLAPTTLTGAGVYGGCAFDGVGVYCDGKFKWGGYTFDKPDGVTTTRYLRKDGTWGQAVSADAGATTLVGAVGGTAIADFSGGGKPGSRSTNTWLQLTINGTNYYIPAWQ